MMIAKILVVDDQPDIRALIKDFLKSKHHHVLEATDGAQAFAVAEQEVPHLIIMDIVMPGLYGSSASRKLQDYWRTAKIPIIIISGSTDAPVQSLIEKNPNIRFLKKPIDLQTLDKTVHELLPHGGYVP
jgi:CheY-like chemotaxis protein